MRSLPLLLMALGMPLQGSAEVFKWTDAQGRVHFSDRNSEPGKAQVVQIRVNSYNHVTYSTLAHPPAAASSDRSVTLYGTSWCGYCKKARRYFQSHAIPYTDLDIETNARARQDFDAMGGKGVPVILVGNRRMNGFSEEGFRQIYE